MALVWDHRSIASVHCSARSYCASPCSADTNSQYTTPVDSGSRSPEIAAIPASSSRPKPCSTAPSRISSRACATRPMAAAAGSHRAHPDGPMRPHLGAHSVSAQHPLVVADHRQPGMRGRRLCFVEELLGSAQPATHRCHQRSVEQQVHRQAHRGARRGGGLTGGHQPCVGALPGLDGHIEVPRTVGGVGQHRQIRKTDLAARLRRLEQVERRRPVAAATRPRAHGRGRLPLRHRSPRALRSPGSYRGNSLVHAPRVGSRIPTGQRT